MHKIFLKVLHMKCVLSEVYLFNFVHWVGLELTAPISASRAPGLKMCTTINLTTEDRFGARPITYAHKLLSEMRVGS